MAKVPQVDSVTGVSHDYFNEFCLLQMTIGGIKYNQTMFFEDVKNIH